MNIHGRGIERKMPTGMAWHGATLKAIYEAIGANFLILETDLNNRCNADNQLLIEGLEYWEKTLGLPGEGTLAERQAAVKQRLGDSGNITVAAITEALHRAGFTNLYAHPNYEYLPLTTEATPMGLTTQMGVDIQMSYAHIYTNVIDPAIFENFAPYETMGLNTQMGEDTQMGYGSEPQGIVVNNLQDDSFDQIPRNPATWTGVFFVCGETKFETAQVPANQKEALRLLLQTIKPFNTAAVLFVEYVYDEIITITNPSSYSTIYVGDTFTISGTVSNIDDGETVTLSVVFPDSSEEIWDTTTIENGGFTFSGIDFPGIYGEGYAVLKVAADHATDSVLIELALHAINITSPADGAGIRIGTTVTIAGTTDFADDSIITIKSVVGGVETTIGTATVSGGAFSYEWTAAGEPGSITLKAVCDSIEDSVDITLAATMVVIEPVENQAVTVGVAFNVSVQSRTEGNVNVYIGNALIATIPIVEGMADGTAVIPDNLAGVGSAFIVDGGGETPAGSSESLALIFVDENGNATVTVIASLPKNFGIGDAVGSNRFHADYENGNQEFGFDATGNNGSVADNEAEYGCDMGTAQGEVIVTEE